MSHTPHVSAGVPKTPWKRVIMFVDNAGADIMLGMLPLARSALDLAGWQPPFCRMLLCCASLAEQPQLPSCGSSLSVDCLAAEPVIMLSSGGHADVSCSQPYMLPAW